MSYCYHLTSKSLNKKNDAYLYNEIKGMKFKDKFILAAHGGSGLIVYREYTTYDKIVESIQNSGKTEIILLACDQGKYEDFHFAQYLSNSTGLPVQYSLNNVSSFLNIPFSVPLFGGGKSSVNPWQYVYPEER